MNAQRDVELFLRAQFEATADTTVFDGQIDAVLSATAGRRQQPAWLAALRSYPMTTTARSFGRPLSTPAWALLMILALLVVITAVGITTGTLRLPPAPIVNGPLVFGRYDPAVKDTAIVIARPDGSGQRVVAPAPIECPQISPDGTKILFAFGLMNIDGTGRRDFPGRSGAARLGCSTWSPDGRRIAAEGFNDTDQSANGIYLADPADGGNVTRLTTNAENGNDIPGDWSPDGTQISFLHGIGADRSVLMVVDVADGGTRRLVVENVGGSPAWSPDGQWIAAVGVGGFVLVHPDGTGFHVIHLPLTANYIGGPAFSPDGTRFLFDLARPGSDKADIYTMKIDGTDLVQITNTPTENEYFVDWGTDPK